MARATFTAETEQGGALARAAYGAIWGALGRRLVGVFAAKCLASEPSIVLPSRIPAVQFTVTPFFGQNDSSENGDRPRKTESSVVNLGFGHDLSNRGVAHIEAIDAGFGYPGNE